MNLQGRESLLLLATGDVFGRILRRLKSIIQGRGIPATMTRSVGSQKIVWSTVSPCNGASKWIGLLSSPSKVKKVW
jgi:hypothetical protein